MGQDGPGWIVGRSGASQPQQVIEKQAAATEKMMPNYERPRIFRSSSRSVQYLWIWASSRSCLTFSRRVDKFGDGEMMLMQTCIMRAATNAERESEREIVKRASLAEWLFFLSQ